MLQDLPVELVAHVVAFCDYRSSSQLFLVGNRCVFELARKRLEALRPYARHHMFREIVSFFDRQPGIESPSFHRIVMRKPPLIVIIGKTKAGKTQLVQQIHWQLQRLCHCHNFQRPSPGDWRQIMKRNRDPILIMDEPVIRGKKIKDFWSLRHQATDAIIVVVQSTRILDRSITDHAWENKSLFKLINVPGSMWNVMRSVIDLLAPHVELWNRILCK